jgi:hypothetical protein
LRRAVLIDPILTTKSPSNLGGADSSLRCGRSDREEG